MNNNQAMNPDVFKEVFDYYINRIQKSSDSVHSEQINNNSHSPCVKCSSKDHCENCYFNKK